MRRVRVIPLLMLDGHKAVVTRKFKDALYVGDPINAIKIFNEKEVDELIILDITDKKKKHRPNFDLLQNMASESFMPLAYGGHVSTVADAERIINLGIEKICFNTSLFYYPEVVKEIVYRCGQQSVVASIDIGKNLFGKYIVKTRNGRQTIGSNIEEIIKNIAKLGVGEILLNSIERDGSNRGFDIPLINRIAKLVSVPLVACGGARSVDDFHAAIVDGKASAVAAGAMFYFKGGFNSVLINYPDQKLLTTLYNAID